MPNDTEINSRHRATDLRRRGLCLIHGDRSGERADSQTSNEATDGELGPLRLGRYLDNNTNTEDNAFHLHSAPTAEEVCSPD